MIDRRYFFAGLSAFAAFAGTGRALAAFSRTDFDRALDVLRIAAQRLEEQDNDPYFVALACENLCGDYTNPSTLYAFDRMYRAKELLERTGFEKKVIDKALLSLTRELVHEGADRQTIRAALLRLEQDITADQKPA